MRPRGRHTLYFDETYPHISKQPCVIEIKISEGLATALWKPQVQCVESKVGTIILKDGRPTRPGRDIFYQ